MMFFKNRTELIEKIKQLEESNEILLKDNQSKNPKLVKILVSDFYLNKNF